MWPKMRAFAIAITLLNAFILLMHSIPVEAVEPPEPDIVFVHTEQMIETCSSDDVGLKRLTIKDIEELL